MLVGPEKLGTYMLTFRMGDYFKHRGLEASALFLDLVPFGFSIAQADGPCHVPFHTWHIFHIAIESALSAAGES